MGGVSRFVVSNVAGTLSGTTTLTVSTSISSGTLGGESNDNDLVGAYVYIFNSSTDDNLGKKAKIVNATVGNAGPGNTKTITVITPTDFSFQNGDQIGISPVLFRYVGGALPMIRTEDGQISTSMDLFKNKQISSIGAHFTDVSGGIPINNFYKAQVYNTESDLPAITAFPRDFSGTIKKSSVRNGESDDYAAFGGTNTNTKGRHGIQDSSLNPSIEIFSTDLDFKLMVLICRGRSTGTDTGDRNTS